MITPPQPPQLDPNSLALVTTAAWRAMALFSPQERRQVSAAILTVEAIIFGLTPPAPAAAPASPAETSAPPAETPTAPPE